MNTKYPTYLEENTIDSINERESINISIKSKSGNKRFDIYFYGDLFYINNQEKPYITDFYSEDIQLPCVVVAKDVETNEEILLYDGYKYGYNGMFCDEFDKEEVEKRKLKKYDITSSEIEIKLIYDIDYDDEKEDYNFDENGMVKLINGDLISWDDVKRNGFSSISIICKDDKGNKIEILSLEVA